MKVDYATAAAVYYGKVDSRQLLKAFLYFREMLTTDQLCHLDKRKLFKKY